LACHDAENNLWFCTPAWFSLHEADRYLINLSAYAKDDQDDSIFTNIYLTHTSLVEDYSSIGFIPYRLVVLPLTGGFSFRLISDQSLDLNQLQQVR